MRSIRLRAAARGIACTAAFLLALAPTAPAAGTDPAEQDAYPDAARAPRWELGLGGFGGWAHLQEAADADPFRLSDEAAGGFILTATWRAAPRVRLAVELGGAAHATVLAGVEGQVTLLSLGLRYDLIGRGVFRPTLRGGVGQAFTVIRAKDGGGEELALQGLAAVFGTGLRLAPAPRLRCDLEIVHARIDYRDASVTLESVYTGTRIDKAGHLTRVQLVAFWLF